MFHISWARASKDEEAIRRCGALPRLCAHGTTWGCSLVSSLHQVAVISLTCPLLAHGPKEERGRLDPGAAHAADTFLSPSPAVVGTRHPSAGDLPFSWAFEWQEETLQPSQGDTAPQMCPESLGPAV